MGLNCGLCKGFYPSLLSLVGLVKMFSCQVFGKKTHDYVRRAMNRLIKITTQLCNSDHLFVAHGGKQTRNKVSKKNYFRMDSVFEIGKTSLC